MSGYHVVIPVFNEAPVLGGVLDELLDIVAGDQVVVVDDCSTDESYEVAVARPVHLLRHAVNLGQGAALRTGIRYALDLPGRALVTFDADGQMSPDDVAHVVGPVLSGQYDAVLGTRFGGVRPEGMRLSRRMVLRAGIHFTRATARLPLSDAHNGFRALSVEAARSIRITQNRMAHASEILSEIARLGLTWTEVPVRIRYTDHSRAKGQSSLAALDILFDLLTSSPRR